MDDALQKSLLLELECPICTLYMAPPIRQCSTGHSICEPCIIKLKQCPLCTSEFTQARNLSLESLASRLQYPCSNAGCTAKLTLTNRDYHERNCGFRNYKCPMETCGWSGSLDEITKHWEDKKICKPYKSYNLCHTKVSNNLFFVNLMEAMNEKFWYKCKIINGFIFFAMQYIGQADKSETFCYEIEIFKPGHLKRKLIVGDYCQSVHINDEDLFKMGASCAYISIDSLNNFIGIDKMLIYHLRVNPIGGKGNYSSNNPHKEQRQQFRQNPTINPLMSINTGCPQDGQCNSNKNRNKGNFKRGGKK